MIKEKLAQPNLRRRTLMAALAVIGFAMLAGLGGTYYAVSQRPELGAAMADVLRKTIGDEAVAYIETTIFTVQDEWRQVQYRVLGKQAAAPWSLTPIPTPIVEVTPTLAPPIVTPNPAQPVATLAPTPKPTMMLSGVSWPPPNLPRMGVLDDEGVWLPYIYDASGRVAAYRTFLQPDKDRPYALAGVVVFNMSITRLGFVLGTEEPLSNSPVNRPGQIPFDDRQPGVLLAMFNGGFKSQHGQYGVMANDVILLPARPNFGTLVIYRDGKLDLIPWDGKEAAKLYDVRTVKALRQNGPLLLHQNVINPEATDTNKLLENWGGNFGHTVGTEIVTYRSGMGLSANRRFMYYVAGPSLTVYTLANVFKTAGASDAMQLDINPYWVHYTNVTFVSKQPKTDPLFPEMRDNQDRYLGSFTRDYFYVVSHHTEQ